MKKINLIFGGIFLGMFLSVSFIQTGKGGPKEKEKFTFRCKGKRKTRSVTKEKEEKPLLVLSLDEMFQDCDDSKPIIEIDDYINSLKGKRRQVLSKAENEYQEKKGREREFIRLIEIYQEIISKYQDPLAFYRLGQIYSRMGQKESDYFLRTENFLRAYRYQFRAFNLKWRKSLIKLVKLSYEVASLLEDYLEERRDAPIPEHLIGMYT